MARHYISIPEPCQENWQQMAPTEGGRHCDRCRHAVVDFTKMSDRQVVEHLRKAASGKVCGRIETRRLQEGLVVESKGWKPFWQSIAAGFGLAMLFGGAASAQDTQGGFRGRTFVSWMKPAPAEHLAYQYANLVTLAHEPALLPTFTVEAELPRLIQCITTGSIPTRIVTQSQPDRWMINRIRDFIRGEGN